MNKNTLAAIIVVLGIIIVSGVWVVGIRNPSPLSATSDQSAIATTTAAAVPASGPSTTPPLPSLTLIKDSGYLYTDGTYLYFNQVTMNGWKEVPATTPSGDPAPGMEQVTNTASKVTYVPGGDLASLVVDGTRTVSKGDAGTTNPPQPQTAPDVTVITAHDSHQTYSICEERWGCMGDTVGCIGNVTLSISSQ